jgi:hypothetical protein
VLAAGSMRREQKKPRVFLPLRGMQLSLDGTMRDYSEVTKGEHRDSDLECWYKEVVLKCLSHYNLAEFSFAARSYRP